MTQARGEIVGLLGTAFVKINEQTGELQPDLEGFLKKNGRNVDPMKVREQFSAMWGRYAKAQGDVKSSEAAVTTGREAMYGESSGGTVANPSANSAAGRRKEREKNLEGIKVKAAVPPPRTNVPQGGSQQRTPPPRSSPSGTRPPPMPGRVGANSDISWE